MASPVASLNSRFNNGFHSGHVQTRAQAGRICPGVRFALALLGFMFLSSCAADLPEDHTDRKTPLEKAAAEGKVDQVQTLLASGADSNAHGRNRRTVRQCGGRRSSPLRRTLCQAGKASISASRLRECIRFRG